MRLLLTATVSTVLFTASCAPAPPAATAIDLAAERAALMQADQAWFEAYAPSDDAASSFVDMLVEEGAHLLPPDAPLAVGKEEIRTVIATMEGIPGFAIRWSPTLAEVGSGGDIGYTIGSYEMQVDGPDGPLSIDGKYLTVWKKQADGSWKVSADMFNADGPPAPADPEGD